jgi:hypothetical protein
MKKYNKAMWAAAVGAAATIVEWAANITIPQAVVAAVVTIVVFTVGNETEIVD